MKNIHLLPTDKPSRLFKFANELHLDTIPKDYYKKYNIYITSDEEIKEGDWFYDLDTKYVKVNQSWKNSNLDLNGKKIILTTDQDLIKDGVQAIDDEFLEWFIKNPSCNSVYYKLYVKQGLKDDIWQYDYKIIIPQEEPKSSCPKCRTTDFDNCHSIHCPMRKEEPKQETLEDAAENDFNILQEENPIVPDNHIWPFKLGYLKGAKWQQERRYSKEDLKEAYFSAISSTGEGWNAEYANGNNPNIEEKFSKGFTQWFEQFKKK